MCWLGFIYWYNKHMSYNDLLHGHREGFGRNCRILTRSQKLDVMVYCTRIGQKRRNPRNYNRRGRNTIRRKKLRPRDKPRSIIKEHKN